MYSPLVLDHFQNPRNAGEIVEPDASAQSENPVCGDVLKLTVKLEGDRIADIRFLAKGCVPAMACGSAITELVKGRTLGQVRSITRDQLIRVLGELPKASTHAAHLAVDTLKQVLATLPTRES